MPIDMGVQIGTRIPPSGHPCRSKARGPRASWFPYANDHLIIFWATLRAPSQDSLLGLFDGVVYRQGCTPLSATKVIIVCRKPAIMDNPPLVVFSVLGNFGAF